MLETLGQSAAATAVEDAVVKVLTTDIESLDVGPHGPLHF